MALILWWSAGLSFLTLVQTWPKKPPSPSLIEALEGFQNLIRAGRSLPREHIHALKAPHIQSLLLHLQAEGLPLLGPLEFLKSQQMDLERQASKIRIKSQGTKAQALVLASLTPILAVVLKGVLPEFSRHPAFNWTLLGALCWSALGVCLIYHLQQRALRGGLSKQELKCQERQMERLHLLAAGVQGGLSLGAAQLIFKVQDGDDLFVDQLKETSRTEGTGVLQPLFQKLEQLKSSLHENREKALETLPTKLLLPLFLSFAPSAMSLLACSLYLAAKDLQLEP